MLSTSALRSLALRALFHEADALHAFLRACRVTVCTRRLGVTVVGTLGLSRAVTIGAALTAMALVRAIAGMGVALPGAMPGTVTITVRVVTARRLRLWVATALRALTVAA